MAIRKYFINKDNTITDAYQSGFVYRATGSNVGESDTLQVFSIYAQATTSSHERARILLSASFIDVSTDRTSGIIPASGSCNFYLNLFNAEHPFSVPRNFILCVSAITSSNWDEGVGIDDDGWNDIGTSNWNQASTGSSGPVYWVNSGSDFYTGSYVIGSLPPTYTQSFSSGLENLSINVTSLAEEWIAGTIPNYGMCIYLTSSHENSVDSYYVKKFFGRGSEFFLKRPTVTCEWDDSINDDRGYFFASSSLCNTENLNKVYLYNKIRGKLKTIPEASSSIYIRLYDDRVSGSLLNSTVITGGLVSTGIYSASYALSTTSSIVYDRWFSAGLSTCYYTGSISVKTFDDQGDSDEPHFIVSMPNLKNSYKTNERPRLKIFTRDTNWSPTIYSVANTDAEFGVVKDMYYRVTRIIDNFVAIDYGTGSIPSTRISYDVSGSYFDFDVSNLEEDYAYQFSFIYKKDTASTRYEELPNYFKFRTDKQSY